jgi:LDH2 family malate/lactate/ureidoglycolate dehydrogenase
MDELMVSHYTREALARFANDFLLALGATSAEAIVVADGLVTAASRWHPGKGQGLEKLLLLKEQCENGGVRPNAPFEVLRESPATALIDANRGFGYANAARAMNLAVEKARAGGVGSVMVRHSNHFGQAGYHAEIATKSGMIGIAMTNAAPELAPWGGRSPVLGTNPWGLGVPRLEAFPIISDMALSESGQGMVIWAAREGLEIPSNWVLTRDGRRSNDPNDFVDDKTKEFSGTQLPIGGFKGYGLSLFTDIVAGVLSGSFFGVDVFADPANHDIGHFMLAIDPEFFMSRDEFSERVELLCSWVKGADRIDGDSEILLPGEREFRNEDRCLESGIPVDRNAIEKLEEAAHALNIPFAL